ncbi:DUF1858 domain-containing protein [Sporomusa sp.]|jgi:hybrid cluster-associated redox disulfide protein|uniref:DUF1858 domain-containing protein n=1 Tax=Sporomusa sp. TaxID=2078658 RepID=UPI002CBB6094|nr:DUF1858 domain-containing protein [Sporomusa sp.]HWR05232.1 DUF1858 domain-containing protein [Sporomusa sp.]
MFTRSTPIIEALRLHSQACKIFAKYGMGCIGCMGSTTETIETGATMHDIDVEALLAELNELLAGANKV